MADEVDQVSGCSLPSGREAAADGPFLVASGPALPAPPPATPLPSAGLGKPPRLAGRKMEAGFRLPSWDRAYLPAKPPAWAAFLRRSPPGRALSAGNDIPTRPRSLCRRRGCQERGQGSLQARFPRNCRRREMEESY